MARVALVSGGGRGIGRAISMALAARGDTVAVADLRPDGAAETVAMIEGDGGRAEAFERDVTDSDAVRAAVAQAAEALGPIEVLVNNAGWDELLPFVETDEPFWDRV